MGVTGFFHGGITVKHMDRSIQFYREGLGLEVEFDRILGAPYLHEVLNLDFEEIRAIYLRVPGGGFVELLEYRGIERHPASSRPCDHGGGHLCFYVDGIDEAFERLTSLGYRARSTGVVNITAGPNAGARSAYFADPDGYHVELFERRPGG
jgi:lactoylglutathione lyase